MSPASVPESAEVRVFASCVRALQEVRSGSTGLVQGVLAEASDELLAEAVARGLCSKEAFGELYRRHADGVRRALRRRLVNSGLPGDLDDLAQEVFLAVWSGLAAPEDGRPPRISSAEGEEFRRWLYGRCVPDVVRRHRWEACRAIRAHETAVEEWRAQEADDGTAQAAPEGGVQIVRLAQALAQLSPQRRRVLQLHYLENQSLETCAALLGVSPHGLSRRHMEALAQLCTLLGVAGAAPRHRLRDPSGLRLAAPWSGRISPAPQGRGWRTYLSVFTADGERATKSIYGPTPETVRERAHAFMAAMAAEPPMSEEPRRTGARLLAETPTPAGARAVPDSPASNLRDRTPTPSKNTKEEVYSA